MNKGIFFVGLLLAASGLISPPFALLGGLVYGLVLTHPFQVQSKSLAKFLLQASVVGLGFGMNLHEVVHVGRSGFFYTAVSITAVMLLGLGLGYLIRVGKKSSFLIAAGTAICGGSAIAAVGPIADANEEEMAVSLGAVFILNSIALFLFPAIGFALHLSQSQFGLWSALAIHDTSSVVGATARYGASALAIGTTVKLARALWIVPLSIATAVTLKSKAKVQWPWFILLFCIAALLNTML
ncbi:MAG TPA: putative sulfate exporter family transporter, partial [Candidatus Sulfotelmatobacter sp.]|nr:putative sulfate exporter family transporter [Candidatus Sulfotelmatobacter sp.]